MYNIIDYIINNILRQYNLRYRAILIRIYINDYLEYKMM